MLAFSLSHLLFDFYFENVNLFDQLLKLGYDSVQILFNIVPHNFSPAYINNSQHISTE